MVNCKDEELALPFNMPVVTYQVGGTTAGGAQQRVLGYLVNTTGDIDFPILGTIHAGPVPPNPAELLLSENLDTLIGILKERYDYVILDNVPSGMQK